MGVGWTLKGTRWQFKEKNTSTYLYRMVHHILTMDVLKDIWEHLIWKISAVIYWSCLENVMEKEQALPDETDSDLKGDIKMNGYGNDVERDATIDI